MMNPAEKKVIQHYREMKALANGNVVHDLSLSLPAVTRTLRRIGIDDVSSAIGAISASSGDGEEIVKHVISRFASDDMCGDVPRCPACPISGSCRYFSEGPRIKQLPEHDRPRERILAEGGEKLSDAELLAILLRTGRQKKTAVALAQEMLHRYGDLRPLLSSSPAELSATHGIGAAKVAQIKAVWEIVRRMGESPLRKGSTIGRSEDVYNHFRERGRERKKEYFVALLLDSGNRIIKEVEISVGSVDSSIVVPREAFYDAVRESAAAVIFVHNHPSGNSKPSAEDLAVTKRLMETGKIIGIKTLDHIVISDSGYTSMADEGLIESLAQ